MVTSLPANAGDVREAGSILAREDPLEEGVATRSGILSGESAGQRSLVGAIHRATQTQTRLKRSKKVSAVLSGGRVI